MKQNDDVSFFFLEFPEFLIIRQSSNSKWHTLIWEFIEGRQLVKIQDHPIPIHKKLAFENITRLFSDFYYSLLCSFAVSQLSSTLGNFPIPCMQKPLPNWKGGDFTLPIIISLGFKWADPSELLLVKKYSVKLPISKLLCLYFSSINKNIICISRLNDSKM